jgi:molybdate/tungstate transport system substrate-binding protein
VRRALSGSVLGLALAACVDQTREPPPPPITIFAAASLARPLRPLTTTFERDTRVASLVELGGSIEHARKITELGRTPDVVILVDDDVIASLLPAHIDWYVRFATNRVVVAYGPRSRHADSITAENWWQILARADVHVGRADPALAPAGRHALALLERAAAQYARPKLADEVLRRSPPALLRPNASELAALLEAGEVDYILEYESVARQYGFRFVDLPTELSQPILYGVSVPRRAANADAGARFVAAMLSREGLAALRAQAVNVLEIPVAIGTNLPSGVSEVVRTLTAAAPPAASR